LKRDNKTFKAALELLGNFKAPAPGAGGKKQYARSHPRPDKKYDDMVFPNREYRMLALFKTWNIFHYFFPYKDLIEEDWESLLETYIPRMEQAGNAVEYGLTLLEMAAHAGDSHVHIYSKAIREHFGSAIPPVYLKMVQKRPVIARFLDEAEAKKAGVAVGDIVLKVDGIDAMQRIQQLGKYIPSSTPQAHMRNAVRYLPGGPENSTVTLTLEGPGGKTHDIELTRKRSYYKAFNRRRTGDTYKLLSDDIGYADLDRLTTGEVTAMFEAFKNTKAIIFDMRGYPNSTAWSIASRLTDKKKVTAAKFKGIIASAGDFFRMNYFFDQPIPTPDPTKPTYKGKTVMLINELTQSQAEHTGLFLKAANGTVFIGSGTAGANGDITRFVLPGGVIGFFTGQAVLKADGSQLQRVGLIPDIKAEPTIEGLRQGKDEVLEKAIQYIKEQLKKN
ncbi:MAG: hypothetical protein GY940_23100, partial [bacterium]|nr:hypothetical protein [bacterium]